jgi:PEP-CTERM motif
MSTSIRPPAARLTQRLRQGALALAAGTALAFGSAAAGAQETTFEGYTNGCFGLACVPVGASGPQSLTLVSSGLTYTNSTFDVTTSGGFVSIGSTVPGVNNLGSFTLTGDPFNYNGNFFDLLVTFTAPAGAGPATFTDTIIGSVTSTGAGGVFINFDNSIQHFTFGDGGSFDFFVNDVSVNAGETITVSGTILSAVAAVPEPETYVLFVAGLAAVGFMARRRRKS